jgi:hypothetical protein
MSDISQVDFMCRTADNTASLLDTQTFVDIKSNVLTRGDSMKKSDLINAISDRG